MIASLIFFAAAAAQSPFRPLPDDARPPTEQPVLSVQGREGLPYAFGRRFRSLDEYLAHLRRYAGPIDLPWWRQIGPDRFEQVVSRRIPPSRREQATRAQLLQRYGFER